MRFHCLCLKLLVVLLNRHCVYCVLGVLSVLGVPCVGVNLSLQLKRHIQRTMHTPSDSVEECFTCKKEFSGYWNLMNRRRVEYPSKRKCRCFLKNECNFDDDKCWYRHEFEPKYEEKTTLFIPVKNVTKPLDTSLIWWNTKKVSSR